jgi:FAD/FMN-containing dehydrogenase
VKFAYENDVPIIAYNGHHGTLTTLGNMDYGIQIYLPQLNSLSISADRKFATVGGGINSKSVTDGLWAAGKQTGMVYPVISLMKSDKKQRQSLVPVSVLAS